mmetsp:Transcript_39602/g.60591  ORF Transcript_39602/g.60591 Transcript_39602/m.60591 type:complete len:348 (-) Transcript_39602:10-1053(-)
MLRDVIDALLVLHVHSHELVADLGRVLGVVHLAEQVVLDLGLHLGVVLQHDLLALDFLAPAVLVQALAEENHIGEHGLVVGLVDAVAHAVQVQGEDLVHQHFLAVFVVQVVVVSVPLALVRVLRRSGHGVVEGLLRLLFTVLFFFRLLGFFFAALLFVVFVLLLGGGLRYFLEFSIGVDLVGELLQVREDGVLVHVVPQFFVRLGNFVGTGVLLLRENLGVHFLEAAQGVHRAAFSLGGLEEVFGSRVQALVGVLSGAASASSRGRGISEFSIGTLRVFLLHVSVKRGIAQVGLVTVLAFEITARVVVLRAALAAGLGSVLVVVAAFVGLIVFVGWLITHREKSDLI